MEWKAIRLACWSALLVAASCVQPETKDVDRVDDRAIEAGPSKAQVDRDRARVRAQFEAAARGERHSARGPHSLFGCPHCIDPLAGQIPDEALLDGPMPVWN